MRYGRYKHVGVCMYIRIRVYRGTRAAALHCFDVCEPLRLFWIYSLLQKPIVYRSTARSNEISFFDFKGEKYFIGHRYTYDGACFQNGICLHAVILL